MMNFDPDVHHRRSIRLRNYDYASAGAYFVTVVAQGRECLFGKVLGGEMVLSEAGLMVAAVWAELPDHYPGIDIDCQVVMPNHFHGIAWIVGAPPRGCPVLDPGLGCPESDPSQKPGHPRGGAPTMSFPDIVHRFKSLTTARYRHGVNHHQWPTFPGRLWQRNYFERVIRDDNELLRARRYIAENPNRWVTDAENPEQVR